MKERPNVSDLEFIEEEAGDEHAWDYSDELFAQAAPSSPRVENEGRASQRESPTDSHPSVAVVHSERDPNQQVGELLAVTEGGTADWMLDGGEEDFDCEQEPEISWEDFALLEDDTDDDDEDSQASADDNQASRTLSREERALQIAAEIAAEAGWTREEALLIAEVLVFHRAHGKTRGALRALTCEWRVTPIELRLLYELRAAWRTGGFNRTYWAATAYDGWPNLSWQQALRIVRELRFEAADEVLLFIDDCFEDWASTPRLIDAYFSFSIYLDAVLRHMDEFGRGEEHAMPPFIDYYYFTEDDECPAPGSPEWNDLYGFGLLRDHGLGQEKIL